MPKKSGVGVLVGPTSPKTTTVTAPSGGCVYNNEPNLGNKNLPQRTKSPRQVDEVRRVLGTASRQLPQPTKKS